MRMNLSVKERLLVAEAMKIIGKTAKKRKVELAVILGRRFVERARNFKESGRYGVQTSEQKEAARQLLVGLHRLRSALNNPNLVKNLKLGFPMDEIEFQMWEK